MEMNRKKQVVRKRKTARSKSSKMETGWSDRKPENDGKAKSSTVAVIAGLVFVAGLLVYLAIGAFTDKSEKSDDASSQANADDKWQGPLPAQVAENFTLATTHEQRLKWVRDPERVSAMMMAFFAEGAGAKEKILGITPMGSATSGKFTLVRFQTRLDNERQRLLAVVLTDEGAKVDFECYARHGSVTWPDLLTGVAKEASEVRVFLARGTFYLHEFADEKQWNCFRVTTPDSEAPMHVYAARGSATDTALSELSVDRDLRVTLALRAVGDSFQNGQFEITQLVTAGWVH